jgi:tetratricopeptide (TPR) repeat protein
LIHPRGRRWALIALLASLTLPVACGVLGREVGTYRQLTSTNDPEVVRELRGRNPLLPATWLASVALADSPETALELAARGLEWHPQHTPLLIMRLQILAAQGRTGELIHAARHSLAIGQPGLNQALIHQALVDAQLQSDDPDAAHGEVLIFGALAESPRPRVAELLARVALSYAFVGREDDADDAFDESLAVGPTGPARLLNDIARMPTHRAAARDLILRAHDRHPDHPDLQLYLAVEDMENGQFEAADRELAQLPQPLPGRLDSQVQMLRARLHLLQERPDDALEAVQARLDEFAADPHALMVLLELKELHDQPDDLEFRERLTQAAGHPRGLPAEILQRIESLLKAPETTGT